MTASVPRYVHVADRFDLTVGQDDDIFEYVAANAAVETNGARVPVEIPDDGASATPLRAPLKPGSFEVVVTWDQTASPERPDTPPCTARRVLKMTALPAKAVIGDLDRPRIEGRWQLSYAPIGMSGRSGRYRAKLLTDCHVGGCSRIAVDGEILRWDGGGVYRRRTFSGFHPCRVENLAGRDYTIKRAWRIYEEYRAADGRLQAGRRRPPARDADRGRDAPRLRADRQDEQARQRLRSRFRLPQPDHPAEALIVRLQRRSSTWAASQKRLKAGFLVWPWW